MKFTVRQLAKGGLKTIATVEGTHIDLAKKLIEVYNELNEEYPLATLVEAYIENQCNDNGEKLEDQNWEEWIDQVLFFFSDKPSLLTVSSLARFRSQFALGSKKLILHDDPDIDMEQWFLVS